MGLLRIMVTPSVVESSMFGGGRASVVGLETALARTSGAVSRVMRARWVIAVGSHHDSRGPGPVVSQPVDQFPLEEPHPVRGVRRDDHAVGDELGEAVFDRPGGIRVADLPD